MKIIPRPVKTRWNSTVVAIMVSLEIRPALHLLTSTPKHKLTNLALVDEEWTILSDLVSVLAVSYSVY